MIDVETITEVLDELLGNEPERTPVTAYVLVTTSFGEGVRPAAIYTNIQRENLLSMMEDAVAGVRRKQQ